MGATNSREENWRQSSFFRDQYSQYPLAGYQDSYPQPNEQQESYSYPSRPTVPAYGPPPPQQHQHHDRHQGTSSQNYGYGGQMPASQRKFDRRYSMIADNYNSLEEVTEALARAGLESSNLIVGIDFSKSNEWTGRRSFNGRSLHHIGDAPNPYEQAISIIGKTLAHFDEDNQIPCYGFGDASTHDQDVFSFYPDGGVGFLSEEVLARYKEIVPHLKLAGPTSFAPVIEMATTVVEQSGGKYHVLLIIADGQVTRSVDTGPGQLSPQEKKTVEAIVQASKFPLSIILVGVGDEPWDMMKEFEDNIPARDFDNFQFVNFTEIMKKNVPQTRKETQFALAALMEIPAQYKATMELGLLRGRTGSSPGRVPLPPPVNGAASFSDKKPAHATSSQQSTSSYYDHGSSFDMAPSPPSATYDNQLCPICLSNSKDMAFGCGHQTCCDCGQHLDLCPMCRSPIQTKIKLY